MVRRAVKYVGSSSTGGAQEEKGKRG